jgi:hypothetical protein
MTEPQQHVVVPYARFLACQDRRNRIAAELTRLDRRSEAEAFTPEPGSDADAPRADHVRPLL